MHSSIPTFYDDSNNNWHPGSVVPVESDHVVRAGYMRLAKGIEALILNIWVCLSVGMYTYVGNASRMPVQQCMYKCVVRTGYY